MEISAQINLTPYTTMPPNWRELLCTVGYFDENGNYVVKIPESETHNWPDEFECVFPPESFEYTLAPSAGGIIGEYKGIDIFVETEKEDLAEESNAELDRFLNQFSRKGDNI